jgi:hypothetical protein
MSIATRVKDIGFGILGLLVMVGMLAIGVGLLVGAASFSLWVLKWTPTAFEITLAVSLFVLGPLALIPQTRAFSALGYMIASFSFGAIMWVWGMAFTYTVWGLFAVIHGLVIFGVGVVPIAMLAALVHGDWGDLVGFVIMAVLTYGCRMLAMWLGQKADERAARLASARLAIPDNRNF